MRQAQKLTRSRILAAYGPGDDYFAAIGDELTYRNVRNGTFELVDTTRRPV